MFRTLFEEGLDREEFLRFLAEDTYNTSQIKRELVKHAQTDLSWIFIKFGGYRNQKESINLIIVEALSDFLVSTNYHELYYLAASSYISFGYFISTGFLRLTSSVY